MGPIVGTNSGTGGYAGLFTHNGTSSASGLYVKGGTSSSAYSARFLNSEDDEVFNIRGNGDIYMNELTEDITVEMTFSVDYNIATTETDYNLRCLVSGNPSDHAFQFKYIIGTQKIVAKGVSAGAGNYMLFKYSSGEATNYVVVPADSDESYFVTQNSSASAIYTNADDLPATVADYKDWVVAEAFFTSSNLVTDTSTLNNGNAKAGTIYLNY